MKTENNKIKYFLYARKSSESEDRQMASIDSQIKELKKLAEQNNLRIVKIFSESKSAKAPGREIYNDMIARIKKGEANGIICWKLNRLARNPIDGGEISWMIQQGIIQHIQTFGKGYYPSDNVIVMAVELGMANQYIRDLSVDTKRGLRNSAEKGWYPCYTTIGYLNNPNKNGDKIIKDPERFDLVRKIFDIVLTQNHTIPQILEIINNQWKLKTKTGKKLARSTIYRILSDPFYYGEFEYKKNSGNWFKGKYEPMITKEEFDRIQIILGKKGKPRPQKHKFPFTGMIRCGECGAMITAEDKIKKQKNGNIHYYSYYHCSKRKKIRCSQKTIRKENLEKQIVNILESIEIPVEFKEWALDVLKEENKKEFSDKKIILSSQQKAYNTCLRKLDNLIDMRANDEITDEEFLSKKSRITKEKEEIKSLIEESDKRIDDWIEKATKLFTFAELAKFRFETGTLEEKKEILFCLGSNLLLKNRILSIELQKPLYFIKEASLEVKKINKGLEPLKSDLDKGQIREIYSQNPMLQGR